MSLTTILNQKKNGTMSFNREKIRQSISRENSFSVRITRKNLFSRHDLYPKVYRFAFLLLNSR